MNTKRKERLENKACALRVQKEHATTMLEYSIVEGYWYAAKSYCNTIIKVDRKLAKAQKKFEKLETRNCSKNNKSVEAMA